MVVYVNSLNVMIEQKQKIGDFFMLKWSIFADLVTYGTTLTEFKLDIHICVLVESLDRSVIQITTFTRVHNLRHEIRSSRW